MEIIPSYLNTTLLITVWTILTLPAVSFAEDKSLDQVWESSPHADASSESFTHWDDDGAVPADCATCHSGTGFRDFIGDDGTASNKTDKDHPIGSLVDCETCHNDTTRELSSVVFPSEIKIENIESYVQCMICHQGRSSSPSVDKKLAGLTDDAVDESLGFINVHYRAAAATLYGSEVKGGYQYGENTYAGRFEHVPEFSTCTGCHNAHSTEVKADNCTTCHLQDGGLSAIRISGDDFNGNGDNKEGIAAEIRTLHLALDEAIKLYGTQITGKALVYGPGKYPYYFNDLNENGSPDADETIYPNRYQSWTPRLLKAAYNYQFVAVDTGGYAHNPKYLLQLLYDSLSDISTQIDVDIATFKRP